MPSMNYMQRTSNDRQSGLSRSFMPDFEICVLLCMGVPRSAIDRSIYICIYSSGRKFTSRKMSYLPNQTCETSAVYVINRGKLTFHSPQALWY